MADSGARFDAIKTAEAALLASDVRRDSAAVESLLHPDFTEIGRSGRRWTREETVDALQRETARPTPLTTEWVFKDIAPGIVLVTYLLETEGRTSRHSSIWDVTRVQPRIRFHQGTVVPRLALS